MTVADFRNPQEAPPREPCNVDAELAVLGCVLRDNDAIHACPDLKPEHFFDPVNARIWAVIQDRIGKRILADPTTISQRFAADKGVEEQGGAVFFANLIDHAPPTHVVKDYAVIVADLALKRRLIRLAEETARQVRTEPDMPASSQLQAVEKELAELAHSGGSPSAWRSAAQITAQAIEQAKASKGIVGLSTGLNDLDDLTGGLRRGQLALVAGRPSMGKSTAGLNIAKAIARRGRGVAFFSLEMAEQDLGLRLACDFVHEPLAPMYSGKSTNPAYYDAERGKLTAEAWWKLDEAQEAMRSWPLAVDARPGLTVADMLGLARRRLREWERSGVEPGLIIVDHVTIVRPGSERQGNKVAEVSDISRELAEMAKLLDVPVVGLCQLSRDIEKRGTDKRPVMADLRWSGDLEQDARLVIFLYRPEYYVRPPEDDMDGQAQLDYRTKLEKVRRKLFWIVAKNNNGPTGEVETYCDIACAAIRDKLGASRA